MNIYQVFDELKSKGTDLLEISIETGIPIGTLRQIERDASKNPDNYVLNTIADTYDYSVQMVYGSPQFFPNEKKKRYQSIQDQEKNNLSESHSAHSQNEVKIIEFLNNQNINTVTQLKHLLAKKSTSSTKLKILVSKHLNIIRQEMNLIEDLLNN